MLNRKTLTRSLAFCLVQVDVTDKKGSVIRTSYEVEDPDEDAIGRFGSLIEAERFIQLLCHLNPEDEAF